MSSSGNDGSIAKRWRELHGERSWEGLLDRLDIDLRKFIISYSELAAATYLGFNFEKRSPHAGACLYGRSDLLTSTDVAAAGLYEVTQFVYATSGVDSVRDAFLVLPDSALEGAWSGETNWMGYVAVATDEGVAALGRRDIVVAWRGTATNVEGLNDLDILRPLSAAPVLGSAASAHPSAMVHHGFLSLYMASNPESKLNKASARDQVLEEVRRLVELYKDEEKSITITGHSLGAALATLNAVDIVANGVNTPFSSSSQPACPATAIVFASPRVGNEGFKQAFDSFDGLRALHVKNANDKVPMVPYLLGFYVDVPVTLPINTALSPYLKDHQEQETLHNLDCYLHGVDGDQGSAGGFKLEVERDFALVNRVADVLKDKYPVPVYWWVPKNKCMVKNTEGRWELNDFEEI